MAKLTLSPFVGPSKNSNAFPGAGRGQWWTGVGLGLACGALLFSNSAEAGERDAYWVFFTDKGVSPDELPRALEERTAFLTDRALARRRLRGSVFRNEQDLPVAQTYENAVLATGVQLRTRSRWLNAISVEADAAELERIAMMPSVLRIQPVAKGMRNEPQLEPAYETPIDQGIYAVDYGMAEPQLETMGVPTAHECGLMGEGIVVGVLDSGFRTDHPSFEELDIIGTWDFINDNEGVGNETSDGDASNQDSHGTNCLSLVAGWDPGTFVGPAPRIQALLAKTEHVPDEQEIEEDWYVEGLEWVEEEGADISTSSLGYTDWYDVGEGGDLDGMTAVTTVAVNAAVARGLIALTAAGNNGPGEYTMVAPADSPVVLTIGATNVAGTTIAGFSSRGPTSDNRTKPNIVAPGQNVYVANTSGSYNTGSGTSYATPLAAGSVALILQAYPDTTPAEMMTLLHETASQNSSPDNTWGYGLIDVAEIVADYCSCTDADADTYKDSACGGNDCNDADADINPGATEICDDGVDNDCDGDIDEADEDCGGGDTGTDTDTDTGTDDGTGDTGTDDDGTGTGDDSDTDTGDDTGDDTDDSGTDTGDDSGTDTGDDSDSTDTGTGTDGTGDDGSTDTSDGGGTGTGDGSTGGDAGDDAGIGDDADGDGADGSGQDDDTVSCSCRTDSSNWTGFSGLLILLALRRRRLARSA